MGKKYEIPQAGPTEIDTSDLAWSIRYDETNHDWMLYASPQRDPRRNMGVMRGKIAEEGILSESESDMLFSLLEKAGENLIIKRLSGAAK